jgi:hypothetical protein
MTHVCEGGMGVEGETRRDRPWNYYGKVRCGVSVSRNIAAVPTAAAAAGESAIGNGEVVKGFHYASQSAKFQCRIK